MVGLACFLAGQSAARSSQDNARLDAVVVESRLAQLSELATVSYQYTSMAQFSSSNNFYGVTIPFTTKSFHIMTLFSRFEKGLFFPNRFKRQLKPVKSF